MSCITPMPTYGPKLVTDACNDCPTVEHGVDGIATGIGAGLLSVVGLPSWWIADAAGLVVMRRFLGVGGVDVVGELECPPASALRDGPVNMAVAIATTMPSVISKTAFGFTREHPHFSLEECTNR